jgi:hypothetical protein
MTPERKAMLQQQLEEGKVTVFALGDEYEDQFKTWIAEHNKLCRFADPYKCGAIGGRFSFTITSTSIADMVYVTCACKEKYVFTCDW